MAASSSAVVVEKKEAEGRYEKAIDRGDSAIMLERAGDGLCTLNLGNLMAGESATIRYRYAQLLRYEHGSVRIAVPTVIAPRYGDPAAAGLEPHQVPATDLARRVPVRAFDRPRRRHRGGRARLALAPDRHQADGGGRAGDARPGCLPRPRLRAQRRRAHRPVAGGGRPRRRRATSRWRASSPTCPARRARCRSGSSCWWTARARWRATAWRPPVVRCTASSPRSRRPTGSRSRASAARSCTRPRG